MFIFINADLCLNKGLVEKLIKNRVKAERMVRIYNEIITKGGVRDYATYVGQLSQIVVPVKWFKKENLKFNKNGICRYEYLFV
jgi:hypothetical protein